MATMRKRAYQPSHQPRLRIYRNDSVEFEDQAPLLREAAPLRPVLGDLIYPDVVARQVCFWGGLVFGLIGAMESFYPGVAGVALASRYHSFFYLAAGALLVLPAMMLPPRPLVRLSSLVGAALLALAFLGFFLGAPPEGAPEADRFHWAALPGRLELGTKDHVLLGCVGLLLLLTSSRQKREEPGRLLDMSFK